MGVLGIILPSTQNIPSGKCPDPVAVEKGQHETPQEGKAGVSGSNLHVAFSPAPRFLAPEALSNLGLGFALS